MWHRAGRRARGTSERRRERGCGSGTVWTRSSRRGCPASLPSGSSTASIAGTRRCSAAHATMPERPGNGSSSSPSTRIRCAWCAPRRPPNSSGRWRTGSARSGPSARTPCSSWPSRRSSPRCRRRRSCSTVLVDALRASIVVVGEGFRFGHRAAGDVGDPAGAGGRGHGFVVDAVAARGRRAPPGTPRRGSARCSPAGEVAAAAEVLGRPYGLTGTSSWRARSAGGNSAFRRRTSPARSASSSRRTASTRAG